MKQHVQKMKDSIMAILYHEVKLHDDTARHQFCPQGSDDEPSWCRFKREGEMEDEPHHLDPVFLDLLKPQFDRLSQPELLERCLAGYTQNQNKSFNNLVWIRCPKHLWKGPFCIQIAVNLSILQWNRGSAVGRQLGMEKLDITYTDFTQQASESQDCKRVAESIHRASELEKKKCASQTKYKLQVEQKKKKSEGKTYQSAFFA